MVKYFDPYNPGLINAQKLGCHGTQICPNTLQTQAISMHNAGYKVH